MISITSIVERVQVLPSSLFNLRSAARFTLLRLQPAPLFFIMEKKIAIHQDYSQGGDHEDEVQKTDTVDTHHNDEALRVLARHRSNETWTPDEEKKLRRKIDRKLLTILCITYGLGCS